MTFTEADPSSLATFVMILVAVLAAICLGGALFGHILLTRKLVTLS